MTARRLSPALVPAILLAACAAREPQPLPRAEAHPPRTSATPTETTATMTYQDLAPGASRHGFRATAVYTGARGEAMGARFVHERTGFVFVPVAIQSVPQAFLWVTTFPTSDMGEPHTQEHLLLGKGNVGRRVAGLEDMSLVDSSAFTLQWRTCYHFNTQAGPEVYYRIFEERLDALLHPDYTDEEIRREVRHIGVAKDAEGEGLHLEEKGTVYNEMVSSFERPWSLLGRAMDLALYGEGHPLSFVSGGLPAAIREMKPEDIRRFHRDHYHLANMGVIGSYPRDMALEEVLRRTAEILDRVEPPGTAAGRPVRTEAGLPPPRTSPAEAVAIVDYPESNAAKPGDIAIAWPPARTLTGRDHMLLELLIQALAGDETSALYRIFVDSATRERDLGATSVFGWVSPDQGMPVMVGLNDVATAGLTETAVAEVRDRVVAELRAIASLADGSPELAELNRRIQGLVIEERRELMKFVNSPPRFGFRGTGWTWLEHLDRLERTPGFRKSLTMTAELAEIEAELKGGRNLWREAIARFRLLDTPPHAFASRPAPKLVEEAAATRRARLEAEVARLRQAKGAADDQAALRAFHAEYEAETRRLEAVAAEVAPPPFLDRPPLGLDEPLEYARDQVRGVDVVASTFDSMTGATVGLALSIASVRDDELVYLAALPALLTDVGVIEDGKPVSYLEVKERLRREVLGLAAYYATDLKGGRAELVMRGSGLDAGEARRAIGWMRRALTSPDLRPENLARLRDVADQAATTLRNTMNQREEAWVNNPANAWWRQDDRLLLAATSLLTQAHDAHRLRWLLREPVASERDAVAAWLGDLEAAGKGLDRKALKALAAALKDEAVDGKGGAAVAALAAAAARLGEPSRELLRDAAGDLEVLVDDLPDASLASDWSYLCRQIRADLLTPPGEVLAAIDGLRRRLLARGGARLFAIASSETRQAVTPDLAALVGDLAEAEATPASRRREPLLRSRVAGRDPDAATAVHVGLVNPNTQSGVFVHSGSCATYHDIDDESLLRFLATKLYAGGGAHSMFMKTWGAGLAYSNGLGSSPRSGRTRYYAERCPELPQTLRFAIEQLKGASVDPALGEYAVGQVFTDGRAAASYETRGEAMAEDLADGVTPARVRAFRERILELRRRPDLAADLFERMEAVYGELLPGYGPPSSAVKDGVFLVIGPEPQLAAYEAYLKVAEGSGARLHRLYPRDFWMPAAGASQLAGTPNR